MRRVTLALLSLALLLGACTGTQEELPETLLIVGFSSDTAGSALALVQDCTRLNDTECVLPTDREDDLDFLPDPNSLQPLPAPPVAYDMVDRAGDRSPLVVLSRDDGSTTAFINFFAVSNIDGANPTAFGPVAGEAYTINPANVELGGFSITAFCPVALQVSSDGRYIALLSVASQCPTVAMDDALDIIDLKAEPRPTVIEHITGDIIPESFYLDQGGTSGTNDDRLYYLTRGSFGVMLQEWWFADLGVTTNTVELDNVDANEVRDLGLIVSNLVVLLNGAYVVVPDAPCTGACELSEIETQGNSQKLVLDELQIPPDRVLILNGDATSFDQLTVHEDLGDQNEQDTPLSPPVVDGTVESLNQFAYLVGEGSIVKFDVRDYDGDFTGNIGDFNVPGIVNPTFITWVQAAFEPDATP